MCANIHAASLRQQDRSVSPPPRPCTAAFTRYCFTPIRLCTNQTSFLSSGPPALPTLLQYCCTSIGQYATPHPNPLVYAIHHTTLAMAISCNGQCAQQHVAWRGYFIAIGFSENATSSQLYIDNTIGIIYTYVPGAFSQQRSRSVPPPLRPCTAARSMMRTPSSIA